MSEGQQSFIHFRYSYVRRLFLVWLSRHSVITITLQWVSFDLIGLPFFFFFSICDQ